MNEIDLNRVAKWEDSIPPFDEPFVGIFEDDEAYIFILTPDNGIVDYSDTDLSIFNPEAYSWNDTNEPPFWAPISWGFSPLTKQIMTAYEEWGVNKDNISEASRMLRFAATGLLGNELLVIELSRSGECSVYLKEGYRKIKVDTGNGLDADIAAAIEKSNEPCKA